MSDSSSSGLWDVCKRCGCLVADTVVHDKFHAEYDGETTPEPESEEA